MFLVANRSSDLEEDKGSAKRLLRLEKKSGEEEVLGSVVVVKNEEF